MRQWLREFTEPPGGVFADNPWWKYGLFVVLLTLLALQIYWQRDVPHAAADVRYEGIVVTLMLLLNHVAFQFRFGRRTTIVLRIIAWLWIVTGLAYIVGPLL